METPRATAGRSTGSSDERSAKTTDTLHFWVDLEFPMVAGWKENCDRSGIEREQRGRV